MKTLPQHRRGVRLGDLVRHMCPNTHNHLPGTVCAVCLIMPSHRYEQMFVTTERLARWQAEQDRILTSQGVKS